MIVLSKKLKQKMFEQNMNAHVLEKKAGLKPSAVQNIINGRSKNPGVLSIQSMAHVLNCSVEDLLEDHDHIQENSVNFENQSYALSKNYPWNQELYFKCFHAVHKKIESMTLNLSKDKILYIIDETYHYICTNKLSKPDQRFILWLIEKQ